MSKNSCYYFRRRVETSAFNRGHETPAVRQELPHFSSPPLKAQVSTNLRSDISNLRSQSAGGGEGSRTPDPCVANAVLCQLSYTPDKNFGCRIWDFEFLNPQSEIRNSQFEISRGWLRGRDLNPRPLGYEPNELPDCSTPRQSQTSLASPTQSR